MPKPEMVKFLTTLRMHGVTVRAIEAAGISRDTAYRWREQYPDFNAAWEQALQDKLDEIEEAAIKRAIAGESDKLTMFLLSSHRPHIYGRKVQVSGNPDQPIRHTVDYVPIDFDRLSPEARAEVLAAYPDEAFYPEEDQPETIEGEYTEIQEERWEPEEDDTWEPE